MEKTKNTAELTVDITKTDSEKTTPQNEETISENTNNSTSKPTSDEEENKTKEEVNQTDSKQEKEVSATDGTQKENNVVEMKNIDIDFLFDIMSVPTYSGHEYRMVTFLILWARQHNIHYEFDDYGNVYLTKGELKEGEYYPCVTSHLDTVQDKAKPYAQVGVPLTILERTNTKGQHEIYVDGMGIGADDKAGVCISLSLFDYFDKIKACFFLEEEVGCKGSSHLNTEWFKDVGYVIGWDSPEKNRAAYACSGQLLFSKDFFLNEIKDICKEHGVTVFNAEPYTDVKEIRQKTSVMCMNFGNGGYLAHSAKEYCILEDMDSACGMGIALIKKLGLRKFRMEPKSSWGGYTTKSKDEDVAYFDSIDSRNYYQYGGYSYNRNGSNYSSGSTNSTSSTTTKTTEETPNVDMEVVEYIAQTYETYIDSIKEQLKEKAKELNIDFDKEFKQLFNKEILF